MRPRHFAAGLFAAVLLALATFWWIWLSPFAYQPPSGLPPVAAGEQRLFVYGTLRHRLLRQIVIGSHAPPRQAWLDGYRREGLDIVVSPGERVEGLLLTVDAGQLRRLDRYERLGVRYDRYQVTLADGTSAWVYRRIVATER